MRITDKHDLGLVLQVWALRDDYDGHKGPNHVSATSLLKPAKATVLANRIPYEDREIDAADLIAARIGTAIHDSIERAWSNPAEVLKRLGTDPGIADRIKVNPTPEELAAGALPVWMENRVSREIDGWEVSGKYDLVLEGHLYDFKSTSVWSYLKSTKDLDYVRQASVYRWLNPGLITGRTFTIQFIFTDWKRAEAKRMPDYPPIKAATKELAFLSLEETEAWIRKRLALLAHVSGLKQPEMPDCTPDELWMAPPVHKYYADPDKAAEGGKPSKNFDNLFDAQAFVREKGKGTIVTVQGEAKACEYCKAFPVCTQKDRYYA